MKELSVHELARIREAGHDHQLVDVRTADERAFAHIDRSTHLFDEGEQERLLSLPRTTQLVFYCHHGVRSRVVSSAFEAHGFTNVHNLTGGIEDWSLHIDPSIPRY